MSEFLQDYVLNGTYVPSQDKGRKARVRSVDLNPLQGATITADGYSQVLELGDASVLRVKQVVSTVTTDDTLDTVVQTSKDGTTWYTAFTFTQVTAATDTQYGCFAIDRFVRILYNLTAVAAPGIVVAMTAEAVY